MIIHIRGHTGKKPFACPRANCPETFASKSMANRHLRSTHTGEKPFKCEHKRTHRNDELKCDHPNCQDSTQTFRHSGTLGKHKKYVHATEPTDFKVCSICNKKFNKQGYSQHKKVHRSKLKKKSANAAQIISSTAPNNSNFGVDLPKLEQVIERMPKNIEGWEDYAFLIDSVPILIREYKNISQKLATVEGIIGDSETKKSEDKNEAESVVKNTNTVEEQEDNSMPQLEIDNDGNSKAQVSKIGDDDDDDDEFSQASMSKEKMPNDDDESNDSINFEAPEEPPIENEMEAANAPRSLRKKQKFDYTKFYI